MLPMSSQNDIKILNLYMEITADITMIMNIRKKTNITMIMMNIRKKNNITMIMNIRNKMK